MEQSLGITGFGILITPQSSQWSWVTAIKMKPYLVQESCVCFTRFSLTPARLIMGSHIISVCHLPSSRSLLPLILGLMTAQSRRIKCYHPRVKARQEVSVISLISWAAIVKLSITQCCQRSANSSCMLECINWPCAWDIRYSHFVRRFSNSDFAPLFKGCMDCQDRERERGILPHILVPRPVCHRSPLSVEMLLVAQNPYDTLFCTLILMRAEV